jgi:hypothetical protein
MKMTAKARSSDKTTLQLHIALRRTDPIVWRRVLVAGAMPLDKLHSVFQVVMGWGNRHLHAFEVSGQQYGVPDDERDDDVDELDEVGIQIQIALGDDDRFTYEYDFGDGWVHDVIVEDVIESEIPLREAVCLDGARACPPEDCGGTSAFAEALKILSNPSHLGYREMTERFGGMFDPEFFSLIETNAKIQRIR